MKNNRRSYRKGNPRNTKSSIDGRKFKKYDQVAFARLAIRLCEKQGIHAEMVAQRLGVSVRTVYRWQMRFKRYGWKAFPIPKPERKYKLNESQINEIVAMILATTPLAYGFQTVLWTRQIIANIILNKFNISLHETTIGRILKRYKVTPQKPIRKAYQQNEIEVEYFCNVKFPEIVERAKNEGAIIVWLDESSIKSDPNNGHTWGQIGRTPVIQANGNPEKINVIGSIDQNGETLFMTYEGNTDSEVVIKYLDMLAKNKKDKIYLILDNAKYHKSNIIKEHVSKYHKGWLELIYLPSYSPELNPCELMWAHLKSHGINRLVTKTKSEFHSAVELHLKKFGNEPTLCKSFFRKNELRFIEKSFSDLKNISEGNVAA